VRRLTVPGNPSIPQGAGSTTGAGMSIFFRAPLALALTACVIAGAPPALAAAPERPLLARYADALGVANAHLATAARLELAQRLLLISSYYRLDPRLLIALVTVESSWPYRETQAYVENVVTRWQHLAAALAIPARSELIPLTAPTPRRPPVAQATPRPKRLAAAPQARYHSPYLDAPDPNGVPLASPSPSAVVWERSHSFFARLLGLRHRASAQH
jgi:hypothetical protein